MTCPDCGRHSFAKDGGWCLYCNADRIFEQANREKPKRKRQRRKRLTKWDKLYLEEHGTDV